MDLTSVQKEHIQQAVSQADSQATGSEYPMPEEFVPENTGTDVHDALQSSFQQTTQTAGMGTGQESSYR